MFVAVCDSMEITNAVFTNVFTTKFPEPFSLPDENTR